MNDEADETRGVADKGTVAKPVAGNVRTAGVTVGGAEVVNERSTAQLPDSLRTVAIEVVERLRGAVLRVKLIDDLRANLRITGPLDDLLLQTVREVADIYGGAVDYNGLYLRDVAIVERCSGHRSWRSSRPRLPTCAQYWQACTNLIAK